MTITMERTTSAIKGRPTTDSGIKTQVKFYQLHTNSYISTTNPSSREDDYKILVDFTELEGGGIDLDELIEHL
jgi:hypothetical protein